MTWRYKLLLPVSKWIPSKWVLCLGRPHRRYSIYLGYYGMTQQWVSHLFSSFKAFWRLRSRSTFATLVTSSGKRPLSWHPKFLLLFKDLWALKGYFINANGLNNVTQPALYCFSNNFHYVGLQKTRFTRIKTFQRAKHLWHKAPPAKHQFLISISHGLFHWIAGVGLLITPTCPVRDLRDVTLSHARSPDILSR